MPSHLRSQSHFNPVSAHNTEASFPHKTAQPPQKKQKMTITQTYRLAHSARGKLSMEASRGDHDLRLLVGHANLLDSLMLELQDAENEQEAWFNETMKDAAPKSPEEPKHIQWKDEIISQHQIEVADDEQDSDEEDYESEDELEIQMPLRRVRSPPPSAVSAVEYFGDDEEEDDEESDDEYDNLELALVRTQSHSVVEPLPELVNDNSDDSDDESSSSSSPPNSPPQISLTLKSQKQEKIQAQDFVIKQTPEQLMLEEDGYFIPPRQQPLIAAY